MRLIDADKFKQHIAAITFKENPAFPVIAKANALCDMIDAQSTAYDVDKVVEQLDTEIELKVTDPLLYGRYLKKNRAIEIVKAGGVNE